MVHGRATDRPTGFHSAIGGGVECTFHMITYVAPAMLHIIAMGWLLGRLVSSFLGWSRKNPVGVKSQVCSIHFIDKLIFNAFSVVHRFFVQFHWPGMLCTLIGLLACGMQVDLGWIASCPFAVAPQVLVNEGDDRRVGHECFPDDS